jgi:cell wall-associated NlpC family hydrolase
MSYGQYLGIPFKHLGRSREEGVDCYGLLMLYFKEQFGIEMPDWWYEPDWSKKGCNYFLEKATTLSRRVMVPKNHDVVLFFTNMKTRVLNHAGIVVQAPNKVIQATKMGTILTDINTPILKCRVEGFYRVWQR